jgi:cytochrome c553
VLRYASGVISALRRSSLVLLWLLLALLPLRGWAHLSMHLPAAETSAAAPCHGAETAPDPSTATPHCTLCDICHGAILPWADVEASQPDRRAQPLPGAAPPVAVVAEADSLFRPPRR